MGQQLAGPLRGAGQLTRILLPCRDLGKFSDFPRCREKSIHATGTISSFSSSPTQLPYRTGNSTTQARINIELIEQSLIQISRYRFSLVISGLTKMLQRVNEIVSKSYR